MLDQIQSWIMLGVILGLTILAIYLYLVWYFIKSAVKQGVEEAILSVLEKLDIIEYKNEESSIDFEYMD